EQYRSLLDQWQAAGLDRRKFLRLVAVGASAASLSAMMGSSALAAQDDGTPEAGLDLQTVASPEALMGGEHPKSQPFVDKPLTVALNVEPDNLDVQDTTSNVSASVDKCIYEGLVTLD